MSDFLRWHGREALTCAPDQRDELGGGHGVRPVGDEADLGDRAAGADDPHVEDDRLLLGDLRLHPPGAPGRAVGEPEDLAGPLLFLASKASDFYTGHILYADGGYTAG